MFDFKEQIKKDKEFIDEVWEKLDKKMSVVAVRSREKCPYTSKDGVHVNHRSGDITWWTNGFWGGLMWLMYVGTKNDVYKISAERNEELLDEALAQYFKLHHDVGFMWHITAGVNYAVTGNEKSRIRNMFAASTLASRYNANGKFIKAWNEEPAVTIIDCMMNIPLLYWASRETEDPRFKQIAMNHADTTIKNHIRDDGSVKHICEYDSETGECTGHRAGQGYGLDSSWSRGQSWALHGFALSYIHTGKKEYLDIAKKVAHYFISCVCEDYAPKADFRAPDEPLIYDTSASAIAAAGLLEIAKNVSPLEGQIYYNAAMNLIKVLDERFANYTLDDDSVLGMASERWTDKEEAFGKGAHVPLIWGDYYYVEAIYKLKGFELLFE